MFSVTVIIPTRNRADTLRHSLATLTACRDDHLEILVSDNASDDDTENVVATAGDSRIRYINTGRRLGMSQNWELALQHANGDWIGYLGDDDGFLPDALTRLRETVSLHDVEAVRPRLGHYVWPSLSPDGQGRLSFPLGTGSWSVSTKALLNRVINGQTPYTQLPMIYHGGFASRKLIDRCRDVSGKFFLSQIPDVYSAIVLAAHIDRHAMIREPFALNGASRHSTGTALFTAKENGSLRQAAQVFSGEDNLPFHPMIPLAADGTIPKSLHALTLESLLHVRDHFCNDIAVNFDRQIKIIRDDMREEAPEWFEAFAERTGVSKIPNYSPKTQGWTSHQIKRVRQGLSKDWHSIIEPRVSLDSVAAAAGLAGEILRAQPSWATTVLRKVLGRLASQQPRRY